MIRKGDLFPNQRKTHQGNRDQEREVNLVWFDVKIEAEKDEEVEFGGADCGGLSPPGEDLW